MADLRRFAGRRGAGPASPTDPEEAWEDDLTLVILRWRGAAAAPTNGTHVLPAELSVA